MSRVFHEKEMAVSQHLLWYLAVVYLAFESSPSGFSRSKRSFLSLGNNINNDLLSLASEGSVSKVSSLFCMLDSQTL